MVICLELGAHLHMAQLMPLPLTVSYFSKIQIGLPFWYRLTRVVPEKGPLNARARVCVLRSIYHQHQPTPLLRVFTPLNIHVIRRLFRWRQWEKRLKAKKGVLKIAARPNLDHA